MSFSIKEGVLISAQSLAADFVTDKLETRYHDIAFVQATYTGADANDAVMTMQGSADGTNWDTYSSSATTLTPSGSGSASMEKEKLGAAYIRVAVSNGTNTTGTITLRYVLKASK